MVEKLSIYELPSEELDAMMHENQGNDHESGMAGFIYNIVSNYSTSTRPVSCKFVINKLHEYPYDLDTINEKRVLEYLKSVQLSKLGLVYDSKDTIFFDVDSRKIA